MPYYRIVVAFESGKLHITDSGDYPGDLNDWLPDVEAYVTKEPQLLALLAATKDLVPVANVRMVVHLELQTDAYGEPEGCDLIVDEWW